MLFRSWAAVTLAEKNGIRAHLHEVFGKEMGEELLYLAIFKLAGGGSMMTYDLWRQKVWLPKCKRLTGQSISEILAANISPPRLSSTATNVP